jgi:DNA (cytosine-5)-methyltransferase 1
MSANHPLISLFTGAGGLDVGLERAGFSSRLCVEISPAARLTLKANRPNWNLLDSGDALRQKPEELLEAAEMKPGDPSLVMGGPPCQPFSKAGYWVRGDARRMRDPRAETLTAFLAIIRTTLPAVLLLENVPGLGFRGKSEALRLIKHKLRQINRFAGTSYRPFTFKLDAADFGVPQHRKRLFIIAHREGRRFEPPSPTHHSAEAASNKLCLHRTAWDAIGHLDHLKWPANLKPRGKYADLLKTIPEGYNYLWHTPEGIERWRPDGDPSEALWGWRTRYWSFLLKLAKNRPSWTISALPGPATGPFHWRSRLLSIEELCLLQAFPAGYKIEGMNRAERVKQIGNAVPPPLGEVLGVEIRRQLFDDRTARYSQSFVPERRGECPIPEPISPMPIRYRSGMSEHRPHPGAGRGPGVRRPARNLLTTPSSEL